MTICNELLRKIGEEAETTRADHQGKWVSAMADTLFMTRQTVHRWLAGQKIPATKERLIREKYSGELNSLRLRAKNVDLDWLLKNEKTPAQL